MQTEVIKLITDRARVMKSARYLHGICTNDDRWILCLSCRTTGSRVIIISEITIDFMRPENTVKYKTNVRQITINSIKNFNGIFTIFAYVMIWIAWNIVKLVGTLKVREKKLCKFQVFPFCWWFFLTHIGKLRMQSFHYCFSLHFHAKFCIRCLESP